MRRIVYHVGMTFDNFISHIRFEAAPDERVEIIAKDELEFVKRLKAGEGTDIYLCGGGTFAGFLLENELIDELKINFASNLGCNEKRTATK
jgi:dihydrofolate reductase